MYAVPLHPTQEFISQILNAMYRALRTRFVIAKAAEGPYTVDKGNRPPRLDW